MISVIFTDAVKSVAAMGGHSIALWSSLHRLRDLSSVKQRGRVGAAGTLGRFFALSI